jgi:hypothetical protein
VVSVVFSASFLRVWRGFLNPVRVAYLTRFNFAALSCFRFLAYSSSRSRRSPGRPRPRCCSGRKRTWCGDHDAGGISPGANRDLHPGWHRHSAVDDISALGLRHAAFIGLCLSCATTSSAGPGASSASCRRNFAYRQAPVSMKFLANSPLTVPADDCEPDLRPALGE